MHGRTLSLNASKKNLFYKIIDYQLRNQSISCYRLNHQLLLNEFDDSEFQEQNYIYNLTVYHSDDYIVSIGNLYSFKQLLSSKKTIDSFIYYLK